MASRNRSSRQTEMTAKRKERTGRALSADMEERAAGFLKRQGLKLLERNYRQKCGEIDLIMQDACNLAFIEVKYRRNEAFAPAHQAINAAKRRRIARTAAQYLIDCPNTAAGRDCRFDVILLRGNPSAPRIEWIKDAFRLP